jgi:hypothetical protein
MNPSYLIWQAERMAERRSLPYQARHQAERARALDLLAAGRRPWYVAAITTAAHGVRWAAVLVGGRFSKNVAGPTRAWPKEVSCP